jgi:hypothetical protein
VTTSYPGKTGICLAARSGTPRQGSPAHAPGRSERPQGAGAVVLHRHRVAGPSRACRALAAEGQPGRSHGPTSAAELDRRGRQRPVHRRGAGRGAGTKPAVGDGDDDPGDAKLGPVASSTSDATVRDAGWRSSSMPAFRSVVSVLVSLVRSFSTNSRPALRAASGRPCPATTRRSPGTGLTQRNRWSLQLLVDVGPSGSDRASHAERTARMLAA